MFRYFPNWSRTLWNALDSQRRNVFLVHTTFLSCFGSLQIEFLWCRFLIHLEYLYKNVYWENRYLYANTNLYEVQQKFAYVVCKTKSEYEKEFRKVVECKDEWIQSVMRYSYSLTKLNILIYSLCKNWERKLYLGKDPGSKLENGYQKLTTIWPLIM